jgi:hypothetical protein
MNKREKKHLSQHSVNIVNLLIAIVALVIGGLGGFFQLNSYLNNKHDRDNTQVVYYSPPQLKTVNAKGGSSCIGALTSIRGDAYRCFAGQNVLDPCFWEDLYIGGDKSYFYCPANWQRNSRDTFLAINNSNVERRYFDVNSEKMRSDSRNNFPWLVELSGGVSCRLISGAVGIAYGDKGNIYTCSGHTYDSVTTGQVIGSKYYFECKDHSDTIFHQCFADRVVF